MILINNPARSEWKAIAERPHINAESLRETVGGVIDRVKREGDRALFHYEELFDKVRLRSLEVTQQEMDEAEALVSPTLKEALLLAKANIEKFHAAQLMKPIQVETQPGVTCWQRCVPIERVGLYVPGGSAPLFSTVLMLAVPARLAGCRHITLCTPPMPDGKVHAAVLVAARMAGVSRVFKVGGAQAIAAMACGTPTIPRVFKIFGPGNQYVTTAKQLVAMQEGVAIDMPAGPSEVLVLADETANPVFVAADLLSQAEHGGDSQAMLITTSATLQQAVKAEVERQTEALPRKSMVLKALENSKLIVVDNMDTAIDMANEYAPEHLIIQTEDPGAAAARIAHAGSVFLGLYACESAGDYASGTNHTLPTAGHARAYSGVNIDSFCRKMTLQHITPGGIGLIGPSIEAMAEGEGLTAHKNAVSVRLEALKARAADGAEASAQREPFSLEAIVRPNIWSLAPYSCARNEYGGTQASVFLDANENPHNTPFNRYPDPLHTELKQAICAVKQTRPECVFCGNGSDEAIDLAFRIFCEPGQDNVVAIDPTYGMYQVCADVNNVAYRKVKLNSDFQLCAESLLEATDRHTKLLFICTPNNPTGNNMSHGEIRRVLEGFRGMVVIDEAYSDFSGQPSFTQEIDRYPNLLVLQTLSKAWGCAAIRLGMAFAQEAVIGLFNKVKYPYNVNLLTQKQAIGALAHPEQTAAWVRSLNAERGRVMTAMGQLPITRQVFPSNANFFLARVSDANAIYNYLIREGIVVRNRSKITLCNDCLRITIGTPDENNALLETLKRYEP